MLTHRAPRIPGFPAFRVPRSAFRVPPGGGQGKAGLCHRQRIHRDLPEPAVPIDVGFCDSRGPEKRSVHS